MRDLLARRGWSGFVLAVLAAGLILTAALTAIARVIYDHNESRLLDLRVRELGLVLASALPTIQTPLASASVLADATGANPQRLRLLLGRDVGPGRQFLSVSAWPLQAARPAPATVIGSPPLLARRPALARALLARVRHARTLTITGLLVAGNQLRLGYGFATPGVTRGFAMYAEAVLPADRRSRLSTNSAFADLNYVLYLGPTKRTSQLLVTNLARVPATGRTATDVVRFGDSELTLVVTARRSLGGTFFEWLPWIIAASGVVLTIAAAALTDRLVRRRRRAEELAERLERIAAENQRLYAEQRSIADALQHALLPQALPSVRGLVSAARYVAGTAGVEIGGDWYDLIAHPQGGAMIVVGDVAGRGVPAATTMASLRFAVLAYATEGHDPAGVLNRLARFVDGEHGYFATVLCARLDLDRREITLASAGHLPPLMITDTAADYLPLRVGVPIGAGGDSEYEQLVAPVPARGTLLAYTDGLVERRTEVLDAGLARLRRTAASSSASLDQLLETLVNQLPVDGAHEDDTAILAVQWAA